jgi:hypothetical protein
MLKKIAIGALAIIAIILVMATMQPDSFAVTRSVTISAAPEKIVPLVADFHNWSRWSPWEKLDPDMQRTFGGAQSGKGAVYNWQGNGDVGSGRMEITDLAALNKVVIKLDFMQRPSRTMSPNSRCGRRGRPPPSPGTCADRCRSSPNS